jgi:hypothetical protein
MQINEAKVIWIGIGLWAAAFLILLPFRKTLIADGHGWWLYTCLAGAGLGMVGLPMVGRRKAVIHRETEHGRQAGHEEGGREQGRDGQDQGRGKGRDNGRDKGRDNGRDNGRGRGRR